jgi:hypothetical protein
MRLCRSESSHARIRCIDRWQSRSLFKINIADPRYGIVAASACLLFSDSSDQHLVSAIYSGASFADFG